ncbi:MAG: hypothetical protein ABFD54_02380 [Armatimonadota bacterium]|nr:hypothetical protein [bacterium]
MKSRKEISTPCVVRANAADIAEQKMLVGDPGSELQQCTIVESVRKLMAFGLSMQDMDALGIREPLLQTICEYARLSGSDANMPERSDNGVDATLKAVEDQLRGLDMEAEMLNLRKRALRRRIQILKKLSGSLESHKGDSMNT